MERISKVLEQKNYRMTIIFIDEVVKAKFYDKYQAMDTIKKMKEEFPDLFMCGVIEERNRSWEVIWTMGNNL